MHKLFRVMLKATMNKQIKFSKGRFAPRSKVGVPARFGNVGGDKSASKTPLVATLIRDQSYSMVHVSHHLATQHN